MNQDAEARRTTPTSKCSVCGHEAWPVAYGMIMPDILEEHPKTEYAGCVVMEEVRIYPATGKVEIGVPQWACQNPDSRHRWW